MIINLNVVFWLIDVNVVFIYVMQLKWLICKVATKNDFDFFFILFLLDSKNVVGEYIGKDKVILPKIYMYNIYLVEVKDIKKKYFFIHIPKNIQHV